MTGNIKRDTGLSRIDAVLFDFDGTLLDSNELIADSWRYTAITLTGRDISDEEIRSTLGEMLIDSIRRLLPEIDAEYALEYYRDYQREIFLERIKLFDGTEEVLRLLKATGYKTALVTSRLKGSTERGLVHFGIKDLFDAVLTASDTDKFKPDPAPVLMILDMIGRKPEDALFVGDTASDVEAGRAAGVLTALVSWSLALPPEKIPEGLEPDFIINKLSDIPRLLGIAEA